MKISVVTETFRPQANGVATTVASLLACLAELGHDIQLIRPRLGIRDLNAEPLGYEEFLITGPNSTSLLNLPMAAPAPRALRRLWTQSRPDVVHIATEGPLGFSALYVARQLQIPVTSDFRTNAHLYVHHHGLRFLSRPLLAYLRFFHNRTLITTVPSENLYTTLSNRGFRNLSLLRRGVNSGQFNPCWRSASLRASWGANPDDLVLLSVGRLIPEKNLEILVDAYHALLRIDQHVKLVVVGDGSRRDYLQALASSAIFCGNLSGHDLSTHYASADLFLFPSRTDTFGNVVLEALASGLPVIAFNEAAASSYILNLKNGWLAEEKDQEFLAGVMRMHQIFRSDPSLYRTLREEARRVSLDEDWLAIARQFVLLVNRATKHSHTRSCGLG